MDSTRTLNHLSPKGLVGFSKFLRHLSVVLSFDPRNSARLILKKKKEEKEEEQKRKANRKRSDYTDLASPRRSQVQHAMAFGDDWLA